MHQEPKQARTEDFLPWAFPWAFPALELIVTCVENLESRWLVEARGELGRGDNMKGQAGTGTRGAEANYWLGKREQGQEVEVCS